MVVGGRGVAGAAPLNRCGRISMDPALGRKEEKKIRKVERKRGQGDVKAQFSSSLCIRQNCLGTPV